MAKLDIPFAHSVVVSANPQDPTVIDVTVTIDDPCLIDVCDTNELFRWWLWWHGRAYLNDPSRSNQSEE